MTDAPKYLLSRMTDMLQLDDDQMQRLIPDLLAWHKASRALAVLIPDATNEAMIWCDDEKPGEISEIVIRERGSDHD